MTSLSGDLIEYRTQVRWSLLIVIVVLLVLVGRLFMLQVVQGERLETLARVSHVVRERIPASRGTIRDRNGETLAVDVEVSDLMVVPRYVKDVRGEVGLLRDLEVLDASQAEDLARRIEEARAGPQGFQWLLARPNLTGSLCPHDQERMTFDPSRGRLVCTVCGREFQDQRAVIQSRLHELPGFSLRTRAVRHYPARDLTAHAVGIVNEVGPGDIRRSEGRQKPGELIGRSGVERALDDGLRGVPGEHVFVRGAGGERLDPKDLPPPFNELESFAPRRGQDVTLSLDLSLQKAARDALSRHRSGAVVVMDVDTGEVLALYSHPSFDPEPAAIRADSAPTTRADAVLSPLLNKAVTPYPPGSVFKMVTAVAALMEGQADAKTLIECRGVLDYKRHLFRCHKRSGHGEIGIVEALAASCDVFFYTLADTLGLDTLAHYARDYFGLGEFTGIEVPERRGVVPTVRWYGRQRRPAYQPGFALNASVGQGDVRVTPLALARAYAALVNGGRLLRPRLVRARVDPATGDEQTRAPEVTRLLDLPPSVVRVVTAGLHDAVNTEDGTAYPARIEGLPFAGKTGTAQAPETRPGADERLATWLQADHAWFVAYAPSRRPRVVVVAFVEHGGFGGQVAAPVARQVIEAYYADHADEFADLWEDFDREPILEIVPEAP